MLISRREARIDSRSMMAISLPVMLMMANLSASFPLEEDDDNSQVKVLLSFMLNVAINPN
jgi:hypothetical protein